MNKEEKIDKEFNELIEKLNDNQFWDYIKSWKDEQDLCDTMANWDTDTKEEEIKKLKVILNEKLKEKFIKSDDLLNDVFEIKWYRYLENNKLPNINMEKIIDAWIKELARDFFKRGVSQ